MFHYCIIAGLSFPTKLNELAKFERQNPDCSLNVYGIGKKKIVGPLYHTKAVKDQHVNLLYITKRGRQVGHFCLIKDLSRLCRSQFSNYEHQSFICDRCLRHFTTNAILEKHLEDCSTVEPVRINFPPPGETKLTFKNFKNTIKAPFVIYADFECLTTPIEPTPGAYTTRYQKHVPYSVGYQLVCTYEPFLNRFEFYRGNNPQTWFVNKLREGAALLEPKFSINIPMRPLTVEEQVAFDAKTYL